MIWIGLIGSLFTYVILVRVIFAGTQIHSPEDRSIYKLLKDGAASAGMGGMSSNSGETDYQYAFSHHISKWLNRFGYDSELDMDYNMEEDEFDFNLKGEIVPSYVKLGVLVISFFQIIFYPFIKEDEA